MTSRMVKGKVYIRAEWCIRLEVITVLVAQSNKEYSSPFYPPPWMGCKSIAGLPPSIKFTSTHSYTWVERGTVRVKWFAKKYNTIYPGSARIQTVAPQSGALTMRPLRHPQ